jgi:hypothetical protein
LQGKDMTMMIPRKLRITMVSFEEPIVRATKFGRQCHRRDSSLLPLTLPSMMGSRSRGLG